MWRARAACACLVLLPWSAEAQTADSVYTLPPVQVRARRPAPPESIRRLAGQATAVAVDPFRPEIANTAVLLERLPGLSVQNYGSAGGPATVSIRGAPPAQVRVYLDGVPLLRAGRGLSDLAEMPFASLDHVEVYRGFAPPGLPGSTPGGAIHLVTPPLDPGSPPVRRAVAAAGSFGAGRLGWSQDWRLGSHWRGLLSLDALRSQGDFEFLDDNGTPLNRTDDERTPRRNNEVRSDEVLAKVARPLGHDGRLDVFHQWVRRSQGVPGYTSFQSSYAQQASTHHLTSASLATPSWWRARLRSRAQVFFDWRRDTFADPASEIGLGYQDNRDVSQAQGAHLETSLRLPVWQRLALHLDARRESFLPWRRFPAPQLGPEQQRHTLEAAFDGEWLVWQGRARLQGTYRLSREDDRFAGDLRTPYSRRPAVSGQTTYAAPRLGVRLRLAPGLFLEGSGGRYHRSPGFLELFGDGGSIAGSSDLASETGINRDLGIEFDRVLGGLQMGGEIVHFRNRADHLITFLPQSQRTFVARNIGSARSEGEEYLWHLAPAGPQPRWRVDGHYTRLRTEDLGVDIRWYAGKALPGRPQHSLYTRVALRLGGATLGYDYRHLGENFLDRWNRDRVARRDLHGLDLGVQAHALQLRLAIRNLTNDQSRDVAGFPVPGRTLSLGSEMRF